MKTVYLSGGMDGDWQDRVMRGVEMGRFVDPRQFKSIVPDQYTTWDLAGIRGSDIVFAYMSADNPSGYGLALEVGYAKALGKTIIFVCDPDTPKFDYFNIVMAAADVNFQKLDDGIIYLTQLLGIPGIVVDHRKEWLEKKREW